MNKISKIKVSELTSHIGYWMRLVSNNVSHSFARKLDSSNITVAEWVILREMYRDNDTTSPSKVAELTGLSRGAISKLIDRLLRKGLVTREEATGDRRYQNITMTTKSISLIPELVALADENDETFFSVLTESERQTLLTVLKKLAKHHQMLRHPIE